MFLRRAGPILAHTLNPHKKQGPAAAVPVAEVLLTWTTVEGPWPPTAICTSANHPSQPSTALAVPGQLARRFDYAYECNTVA